MRLPFPRRGPGQRRRRRWSGDTDQYAAHHRDLRGGSFRAAIFGVSDGLVSNVSLVLGTFGAHPGGTFVRLAGLAGLFGGSFSMAAGEYVSMRAQKEAFEGELARERIELARRPGAEQHELEHIYVRRGASVEVARRFAAEVMSDPERALAVHAREELGIDPNALGSPVAAALSSFFTFALGAVVPLIPFLGGAGGRLPALVSVGLTALAALAVGGTLSVVTTRSPVASALRSLVICAVAGGITYGIGTLIGVSTS